jgi:glucosylceramidase
MIKFQQVRLRSFVMPAAFGVIVFIAGMISPANAVLKAKWRSSTESAPWANEVNLPITDYSAGSSEILLDTAVKYQTIDGWGGSPNEVGTIALHRLPEKLQDSVIGALFDTVWGCKFNMIRLPIACTDFSASSFSYDDLPAGVTTDYTMSRFSIDRDKPGTIAFTKRAQEINPELRVWGSPWTAPPWMKNNNKWETGINNSDECAVKQTPEVLAAYALYFSKTVTAYKAEGLRFFALSFQNEPRVCQRFPSTRWSGGATMQNFMKNYLRPRMNADHPDVELWTPTMNVADTTYYAPMLNDTSNHITAACFQYEGINAIKWVNTRYPKLKKYATELVCGNGTNLWSYAMTITFPDVKFYIENGAGGAFQWNLILEKNGESGPTTDSRQNCMIAMDTTIKRIKFTSQYYALKHFSYYIRPGSRIIKATGTFKNHVSAKNTNGSIAVVAQNNNTTAQTVRIKFGTKMASASLPPSSFGSFLIYDSSAVSTLPRTVMPGRVASAIMKVAGDRFELPREFAGKPTTCSIYDIQGRMLRSAELKATKAVYFKDHALSSGAYVVRLNVSR